jgi:hypothetical protein
MEERKPQKPVFRGFLTILILTQLLVAVSAVAGILSRVLMAHFANQRPTLTLL